jgi:uncharacterized protein (TIGR03084 family)
VEIGDVRADLLAEQQALDEVMVTLGDSQWSLPTASPRWTVADQIAHLAFFDDAAATAISKPDAFAEVITSLVTAVGGGEEDADAFALGRYRAMAPAELLEAWRHDRNTLAEASASLSNSDRVEWFGPSMGSKSFLTARLMECWAHGQDVVDTVGATRPATDRLRHIAQLGFITRGWTYINRGLEAPEGDVSVILNAPSGEQWSYGPPDAPNTVRGSAEAFCLVVTQRRHMADTDLEVSGDVATDWMLKAQAFAGGVTDGPPAGTFT